MAQVTLKAVSKNYSNRNGSVLNAVTDLNLEIGAGELVVVAGPAGCGKSSILRMIAGLDAISEGEIFIGDRRINDDPPKDRAVAVVPDRFAPYPRMTVAGNLAFVLEQRKFPEAEVKKRALAAAGILELQELLDRMPETLSVEQRQRVAIARAVALQPKLFLFDEPLARLDLDARMRMRGEIAKLHQRLQAAMLYFTRDPIEATALGGRLVVMKEGRVQQGGTAAMLYDQPANSFVARFLGTPPMNLVQGTLKQDRDSLLFSEIGDGTIEARLSSSEFPAARDFAGQAILLGVRAEDIQTAKAPNSERYSGAFPAIVELVERTGSGAIIHLQTGSHSVAYVSNSREDQLEPGQRARFEMDLRKVHLFDPLSTLRIGPNSQSFTPA